MALDQTSVNGRHFSPFLLWTRLPVQPVLIAAVLWSTGAWSKKCKKGVTRIKDQ
jgi:uncharacterized membrane protein